MPFIHASVVGGSRNLMVAAALLTVSFGTALSNSPDDLLAVANSNVCPGSDLTTYATINSSDICNPGLAVTKTCDVNFRAPSLAWQQCYRDVDMCQKQVDSENTKIRAYNSFMYQCRKAFYGTGNSPWNTGHHPPPAYNLIPVIPVSKDPVDTGANLPDPQIDDGYADNQQGGNLAPGFVDVLPPKGLSPGFVDLGGGGDLGGVSVDVDPSKSNGKLQSQKGKIQILTQ